MKIPIEMIMRSMTIWIIILGSLSTNGISLQSGWILQNHTATWNLNSVFFTSADTGLVVGGYYTDFLLRYDQLIGKTVNGGADWNFNTEGIGWLESVYVIDDSTAWAVGVHGLDVFNGTILHFTGRDWLPLPIPTIWSFFKSVYFVDHKKGWIAADYYGQQGMADILASTDSGNTWNSQHIGTGLYSVFFINDTTGWAVGANGVILHTYNSGTNWSVQNSGTLEDLTSVNFISDSTGWSVGSNGTILYTRNGGNYWLTQNSSTLEDLTSIFFINDSTGWAVGSNGTILKTNNGGISSVGEKQAPSSLIPKHSELDQNYPNPFNPTTNIEFSIPKSEFVTLKVYNVLGEEVATLISKRLTLGKYKYDWDASDLASGVYLYRIQAGNYVEAKKMVLIR